MDNIEEKLENIVETVESTKQHWSTWWRDQVNRRTLLIASVSGCVALALYIFVISPPPDFPIGELVTVPDGASLKEASLILENAGVVRSAFALQALETLFGRQSRIRAGDYYFREPIGLFSVARALAVGAYGLEPIRIRIPEGATMRDMAKIYALHLPRFNQERFLSRRVELEGYLFPDTYFFMPNTTDEAVVSAMRNNFDAQTKDIAARAAAAGKDMRDIVILASIIEREARKSADRRLISGVLWNRLEKDMLLQVDAAFLYTLGKGTFQLTLADLASDDPYNTYKFKGLPPTPIGSPSLDSLEAAVSPTKNDYLYYLADKYGTTYYSRTYEEHLRKKRLYLGS